nr:unnamed protein product [Spirometra erinaceieuropaei]
MSQADISTKSGKDSEEDSLKFVTRQNKCLTCLRDNAFTLATLGGVCVGFAIAFGVKAANPSAEAVTWIGMPGLIYLRLLQLTILPLISSNLLLVIAGLDPKKNGRLGTIGILYVILLNLVSAIIGTACAAIIRPGDRILGKLSSTVVLPSVAGLTASDVFVDILHNVFPDNIIGVTLFQYRTVVVNATTLEKAAERNRPGTNMLGVLFVAVVFGIAARAANEGGRALLDFFDSLSKVVTKIMHAARAANEGGQALLNFFDSLSKVVTKIMHGILLLTPVGVCFMVASSVLARTDIKSDFIQLSLFIATVLLGLALHFIFVILVHLAASRENPFRLLKYCVDPYLIAFATTSPACAVGEAYEALDKYGVKQTVSRFTTPLCAVMKGDGPAVFITASCLFLAQQAKVQLSVGQVFIVLFLTFASSTAVPNIPSASIVLVMTVLSSIGVPTEGAGILFAVEWLLDRCRSGSGALSIVYVAATTESVYSTFAKEPDVEDAAEAQ